MLAAGLSTRFPGKLFKEVGGRPVLLRVIDAFQAAAIDKTVVVANPINASLLHMDVEIIINDKPEWGMIHSIKVGLSRLIDADAVVVSPGDHPFITSSDIDLLVANHGEGKDLVVLTHGGRIGHPILIGRDLFPEVMLLNNETEGLKSLLKTHQLIKVESPNPGILVDIDTAADLELANSMLKANTQWH
ncbi:cytidylyltransferase [Thermocladium modestius]|uniref:Cytidylyltransferase n=1 Tax=Thermocladium modestius TaxID=62609 RepID=A0A830GUM5_9CREN|nr:nucleotidyltransferase family protein [Thermocladium modestius]GGP21630.1 cytidylyltransferase [Thermocladium modestius]